MSPSAKGPDQTGALWVEWCVRPVLPRGRGLWSCPIFSCSQGCTFRGPRSPHPSPSPAPPVPASSGEGQEGSSPRLPGGAALLGPWSWTPGMAREDVSAASSSPCVVVGYGGPREPTQRPSGFISSQDITSPAASAPAVPGAQKYPHPRLSLARPCCGGLADSPAAGPLRWTRHF